MLNTNPSQILQKSSEIFYIRPTESSQKLGRYKEFLKDINLSNKIIVNNDNEAASKKYVFFVGKGNNHNIIQSLFKSRFWWV